MAIERCVPTSFPAVTGVTNNTYAYDAPTSATNTTAYTQTSDTTYATFASAVTAVARLNVLSGFTTKQYSWTSATLKIGYGFTTAGDGDVTQWDSSATLEYCLDWNGSSGSFGAGWLDSSTGDNVTGFLTQSIAIPANTNPATVAVRFTVIGHPKSGAVPDIILGSTAQAQVYHAYIEGNYSAGPNFGALNGGAYCNQGSAYNITGSGFTGTTSVTFNGNAAPFSVTNDSTISVTIPPVTAGYTTIVITNGTTATGIGYINPVWSNNGPVYVGNNVTLTPAAGILGTLTVSPGTWGTWTAGTGQSVTALYNRQYTLTQNYSGYNVLHNTTAIATIPASGSLSAALIRQVTTGGGSGAFSFSDVNVRTLSNTANGTAYGFANFYGKALSSNYYW